MQELVEKQAFKEEGKVARKLREDAGITQEEMGALFGFSRTKYAFFERGKEVFFFITEEEIKEKIKILKSQNNVLELHIEDMIDNKEDKCVAEHITNMYDRFVRHTNSLVKEININRNNLKEINNQLNFLENGLFNIKATVFTLFPIVLLFIILNVYLILKGFLIVT